MSYLKAEFREIVPTHSTCGSNENVVLVDQVQQRKDETQPHAVHNHYGYTPPPPPAETAPVWLCTVCNEMFVGRTNKAQYALGHISHPVNNYERGYPWVDHAVRAQQPYGVLSTVAAGVTWGDVKTGVTLNLKEVPDFINLQREVELMALEISMLKIKLKPEFTREELLEKLVKEFELK